LKVSPYLLPNLCANLPPGKAGMLLGFTGPIFSPQGACASGNHAVAIGARMIRDGDCDFVLAGGVEMLRALAGPYGQAGARFIALGGVTPANMTEYLRLPVVAAVGGSWIVEPHLVAAGDWTEVTRRAQEALEIVASLQHPAEA